MSPRKYSGVVPALRSTSEQWRAMGEAAERLADAARVAELVGDPEAGAVREAAEVVALSCFEKARRLAAG